MLYFLNRKKKILLILQRLVLQLPSRKTKKSKYHEVETEDKSDLEEPTQPTELTNGNKRKHILKAVKYNAQIYQLRPGNRPPAELLPSVSFSLDSVQRRWCSYFESNFSL